MLKNSLRSLISGIIFTLGISVSVADDTEIYMQSAAGVSGTVPQVIFHIEYNPNLASTICSGIDSTNIDTDCPEIAPVKLYMADNDLNDGTVDQFELTRAALKRVLAPLGGFKIGLLMPHANNNNCAGPTETGCSGGGYILHRMVELDTVSSSFDPTSESDLNTVLANDPNKQSLFNKLDALPSPQGGFSHDNQLKEIYFELFRYLTGQGVYNGHNGWNDFGTDNSYNLGDWVSTPADKQGYYECAPGFTCASSDTTDEYIFHDKDKNWEFDGDFAALLNGNYVSTGLFQWDSVAESGGNYISPLVDCSQVFVINVLDGGGGQQNDADDDIALSLANGGMNFSPSNNDPGFVEMVGWLHDKDLADGTINSLELLDKQNVTSYFIAKQPQQLEAAAYAGGSGTPIPLTQDAQEVVDAIEDLFSGFLGISTTFVSASIPVNVFNRSEVLDNTYLALFEANRDAQPQWVGNLKKLKLDVYQICLATDSVTGECTEYQNNLRLIDALENNAVDELDGRIKAEALTYWSNEYGYDLYDNLNEDIMTEGYVEEAGRDGRTVHRGGAGQKTPNFLSDTLDTATTPDTYPPGAMNWNNASGGRTLYSESGNSQVALEFGNISTLWSELIDSSDSDYATGSFWPSVLYNSDGSLAAGYSGDWEADKILYTQDPTVDTGSCTTSHKTAALGYSTCVDSDQFTIEDLASNVIAYARGFKVKFTEDTGSSVGDTRPLVTRRWITGDTLHSRPLPINYGARDSYTEDNPDIRIIFGSNDGYLRMIRNTNTDGSESGKEVWAFMPRESLKKQKQLLDNQAGGNPVHPYGVDGAASVYVLDTASGADGLGNDTINASDCNSEDSSRCDTAWAFFGLRRGGRAYYALDITNPDTPVFKWKIDNNTTGFSELGYTFSQPVVQRIDWGEGVKPVIIVGGGYDLDKDNNDPGTNDDTGNAIYIINADTGDLVWKVTGSGASSISSYINSDMVDSIPSTVTPIDADNNGIIDQVYVGDTGGNVWRLDLHGNARSAWQATKILSLGRHVTSDLANDRRFFHAPDIVLSRDATSRFIAVVIGSGNRAHPLQSHTNDAMFMYKDRIVGTPLTGTVTPVQIGDLFDATDNCVQEDGVICNSDNLAKLSTGWLMYLEGDGEKNLASPLTLRGTVYFTTYLPVTEGSEDASCRPAEGSGYQYAVALGDARATTNYDTSNDSGAIEVLQKADRSTELLSGGAPSENVYVSYTDEDGNNYTGALSPDLQPGENLGKQYLRNFWIEKNK